MCGDVRTFSISRGSLWDARGTLAPTPLSLCPLSFFPPLLPSQATLSPSSVYALPGIWQGGSGFEGFTSVGQALDDSGPTGREAKDEVVDRVRALSEQCDSMQGERNQ